MKIITNEFALNKSDYFLVQVNLLLRRRWLVFVALFLFSIIGLESGFFSVLLLFIVLSTFYFIYLVFISWLQLNPKVNAILFAPRHCELDPEFITSHLKDGSIIKIKFDYIKRCIRQKTCYLFFFSRSQFIYIPLSSIPTSQDQEALNMLLKVKAFK